MDKYNRHDPPQGIPPPDADTQQHLDEVAGFSNIKDGFEVTMAGLLPPKFQWGTIEQELQADLITDDPTAFSSIKQGFESSFLTQSAPSFAWDSLDQSDTPAEETPSEDYSVIKKSFEREYSSIVVPLFTWEELQVRMEEDATQTNNTHEQYSNVNKSFVAVYGEQQPAAEIWSVIFKRLHPRAAWWAANRADIGSVVAVLALLATIGVAWTFQYPSTSSSVIDLTKPHRGNHWLFYTPTSTPYSEQTQIPVEQNMPRVPSIGELLSYNTPYVPYAVLSPVWLSTSSNDLSATPTETQPFGKQDSDRPDVPVEIASAPWPSTRVPSSTMASTSATTTVHRSTKSKRLDNEVVRSEENFATPATLAAKTSSPTELAVESALENRSEVFNEQLPTAQRNLEGMDQIGAHTQVTAVAALGETLQLGVATETLQLDDPSIRAVEEASFPIVRKPLTGKRLRIELGAIGRLGTSLLLRPQRRQSMEFDRIFGPSIALGLTGQLYFGKNDALVLSGYPFIMTGHGLREETSNSLSRQTEVELCFMEVMMGYQRVLWRYSLVGEAPSRVYARLDFGVGWLTKSNTKINHRPSHKAAWYNQLQYSVGLSLGTSHELGDIVLDYGITGMTGLNSLVSSEHPSLAQPTRLFQGGAYVSIRYLIQPRLVPSKRMRQFDWSPPFYIEEPSY